MSMSWRVIPFLPTQSTAEVSGLTWTAVSDPMVLVEEQRTRRRAECNYAALSLAVGYLIGRHPLR